MEEENYYLFKTKQNIKEKNSKNGEDLNTTSTSQILDRCIYRFKIILLGDVAVGKSSILNKFTTNKINMEHKCTIGVDFKLKSLIIDDKSAADLQIWDTCGQEKYQTITRNYYNGSNGKEIIIINL